MPWKQWAYLERVTSPDFQTYLQNQTVPQFASQAQRDSVYTPAPPPKGALCITTDSLVTWYYDGSAWQPLRPWNSSWGRVNTVTAVTSVIIPTAVTDWAGLTITWTPIAGRRYELFLTAPGVVPTNNPGNIVYYITDAANAVLAQMPIGGAGMGGTFNLPLNVRAAPISPAGGVAITHK